MTKHFLACVICYAMLQYSHASHIKAQVIANTSLSIPAANSTLENFLEQVQSQSSYNFMFNPKEISSKRTIRTTTFNSLQQVLSYLKDDLGLVYQIEGKNIYLKPQPAPVKFQGTVVDEKGNPIYGASIRVLGTPIQTQTDEGGHFSFSVSSTKDVELKVSYLGFNSYQTSLKMSGDKVRNLSIELQSTGNLLDEINVSYGKQKRNEVTGSIQQIQTEELQDMPVTQFAQQLQGRTPGVQIFQTSGQPGRGMSWRIRGAASLNSGSDPLFVVDGMPITGSINNINPAEIQAISILKDASATALYGSRASNGVILITTKKAKAGEGTKIDFSGNYAIQKIPKRGIPVMMNAHQYATFMKERFEDMIKYEKFTGKIPDEYQNPDQYGVGTDWFSVLTRTAPQQNYDISLSTANEKSSTTVIAGYQDQQGVVVNSGTKLFSLRLNQTYNMVDNKLKLGVNLAPSYRKDHNNRLDDGIQGIVQKASEASPLFSPYQEDGSYTRFVSSPGMVSYINPLARYELTVDDYNTTRILGNAFAEYEIISGLIIKGLAGVDKGKEMRQFFAPSILNTNTIATGISSAVENYSYTAELNASYNKSFGLHNLELLAGYSAQSFQQMSNRVNGQNYTSDDVPYLNAATNITGGTSNSASYALLSTIGRLNYNYDSKYLLGLSIRRDGSSRFGANERYGTFPAISAGWVASKEDFMSSIRAINLLKIRGSYGVTGNNNIGNYTHIQQIGASNYIMNGSLVPGSTVVSLGNDFLAWEKTKQLDIGLDLELFDNKLTFTYDYYNKLSDGLIQSRPIDQASGFTSIMSNVGSVKFWGHEFSLGANFQFGEVQWNSNFNMTFDRNRIEKLVSPGYFRRFNNISADYYRNQEGYPLGMFFGFINEGLIKDEADLQAAGKYDKINIGTIKIKDLNGDGVINENDRTFIGNPNPKFLYGFTNNFKYKEVDLSFTFAGSYGGKLILPAKWAYLTNMDGARNVLAEAADRWRSVENPGSGKFPRTLSGSTSWGRNVNDQWIEDGSYLAMKNITLGYTIPLKSKALQHLRAYASIQNIFYLMNYSGMNPEISLNGLEGMGIGIDENAYPVPRIYSFGFNLTIK